MATSDPFGQFGQTAKRRQAKSSKPLQDGSRVAVVGAGPSGSMFSYFLLNMAESLGLELELDLYEARQFCHGGPVSCNHCGGVVSESLVQRLATEGISLPDEVVQRGLDAYTMHMDVVNADIATPLHESRIAGVYRGNGPRNSEPRDTRSFDGYLQQLANEKGARSLRRLVTGVRADGDAMQVECADGSRASYDLVALACGVNSRLLESLDGLGHKMKFTMVFFIIGALAIAGIPPFNGFASKFLIYESVYQFNPILAVIAMVVSILTLASFVKVFHSVFMGPPREEHAQVREVPLPMLGAMAFLAILVIVSGLFPGIFVTNLIEPAVHALTDQAGYMTIVLGGG